MEKGICFVMMPFGNQFDEYYNKIYLPAIENNNMIPKRADTLYRPSPILHDIWEFITNSALVIADITGRNPNVMYELGLAHAIAKPAILVSNNIEDVPFDLRSLRILLYDVNKPDWASDLKSAIQNSIKEIGMSPIEAVLPTFIKVRPSNQEDVSDLKRDIIEIKQYVYKINEELEDGDYKIVNTKILNREEYGKAIEDAHELYFKKGFDLTQIKDHLVSKYKVSYETAFDIIEMARM